MPIDPCRRDDIVAAVAAHDSANPSAPLPRNTARLLAFMFAASDVCCLSQQAILLEGFGKSVSGTLRALAEAGFLSLAARIGSRARHVPASSAAGAAMRCPRREKVFGPGRAVPLDRNAKARIAAYARAWSARNRQPRQHRGPITRAFLDVLQALLWGFHNSRSGCCFPSYEAIAAKAECARSTVAEATEGAGVGRRADLAEPDHARILVRQRDLFGRWANRWTVIRTSNAYVFCDPQRQLLGVSVAKSENRLGTPDQEVLSLLYWPRYLIRTARLSVPCDGSA